MFIINVYIFKLGRNDFLFGRENLIPVADLDDSLLPLDVNVSYLAESSRFLYEKKIMVSLIYL